MTRLLQATFGQRPVVLLMAFVGFVGPVHAQTVIPCQTDAQIALISEPESMNLRKFANGNVIVAVVDDGRADVATALSVLVISPPLNAMGEPQCRVVSQTEASGYATLVLDSADARYDPASGLTVVIPALVFSEPDALGDKIDLAVTINQATGMITLVHTPSAR